MLKTGLHDALQLGQLHIKDFQVTAHSVFVFAQQTLLKFCQFAFHLSLNPKSFLSHFHDLVLSRCYVLFEPFIFQVQSCALLAIERVRLVLL